MNELKHFLIFNGDHQWSTCRQKLWLVFNVYIIELIFPWLYPDPMRTRLLFYFNSAFIKTSNKQNKTKNNLVCVHGVELQNKSWLTWFYINMFSKTLDHNCHNSGSWHSGRVIALTRTPVNFNILICYYIIIIICSDINIKLRSQMRKEIKFEEKKRRADCKCYRTTSLQSVCHPGGFRITKLGWNENFTDVKQSSIW